MSPVFVRELSLRALMLSLYSSTDVCHPSERTEYGLQAWQEIQLNTT